MKTHQAFSAGEGSPSPHRPYQRPPRLRGYTFDPRDAYRARDDGRLLAIRLETNRSCNLRCRYCYDESGSTLPEELDYSALADIIGQAHGLGARSIVVIGGGEPTLHPRFTDLVAEIDRLAMTAMIFTNAMTMSADLAGFLYRHNASVMTKLDSLREPAQDYLAGREGAARRMRQGIQHLLEAGFGQPSQQGYLRLGASVVACRMNYAELETLWRFCRLRHMFPNVEVLTPTRRARQQLPEQGLSKLQIQYYRLRLLELDREHYGYDWLPYTPLTASGCLQHLYSLYITVEGNVRPCAPTKFDEHPQLRQNGIYPHNIRRRSLREIYEDPLFDYVRHIDRRLEGKCHDCPHADECIGCRGYAYSAGVNQGQSPYQALRAECLHCFR